MRRSSSPNTNLRQKSRVITDRNVAEMTHHRVLAIGAPGAVPDGSTLDDAAPGASEQAMRGPEG
jgi:hypothetical protein